MTICQICLKPTRKGAECHAECIQKLFSTSTLPTLDLDVGELYAVAAEMAGKMSISGVQEKVSLRLSEDGARLEVARSGGTYILKPEPMRFSALPQNEHLTMCLASLVGIETPPFGLTRLKDGALAYVIKRFDRLDDGGKLAVEDFCQLSETRLKDKYNGSAEQCVRILRKYATEPLVESRKLFQLLLFGWWVANGDMHLKNFSLITLPDGTRRLTPAYDLVNTRVATPKDDTVALTMGGRNKKFTRKKWLDFAKHCEIPEKAAERLLRVQVDALDEALEMVHRSFLPEKKQEAYEKMLRENTATLVGERSSKKDG
jgi:serine/threonine-protein kinase HipA